jgi:hypothetical protein
MIPLLFLGVYPRSGLCDIAKCSWGWCRYGCMLCGHESSKPAAVHHVAAGHCTMGVCNCLWLCLWLLSTLRCIGRDGEIFSRHPKASWA